MSLYAGIDAGTQSIKFLVYDAASRQVVATASAPLKLISGEDGSRELRILARSLKVAGSASAEYAM